MRCDYIDVQESRKELLIFTLSGFLASMFLYPARPHGRDTINLTAAGRKVSDFHL